MKIIDLLTEVDEQKPNTYTQADKLRWLSVCEGKIIDSVLRKHIPVYSEEFNGYTAADLSTELLVPDTYVDLYKYYIYAMIDVTNLETKRYEGSMQLYNMMLKDYTDWYNRTHMPVQVGRMRW